jgi:hypothetical protein
MTRDQVAEDLAYVRTVAEEGQHAPLVGGVYLVFFGVLLTVAYLLHWSLLTGLIPSADGNAFGYLWMAYGALAFIGVLLLRGRTRLKPGSTSMVNRVDRAVWWSVGFGIMAVVIGACGRMIVHDEELAPNMIMAAAFAMFCIALWVTATISQQGWLGWFAMLSFAASVGLWLNMNEPWAYLLAAGAGIVVLILPGVMMMRREPSTIV